MTRTAGGPGRPAGVRLLAALLLMSISLSIPGSASARAVPDYRFGVVEAYAAPGAASVLGAGWERVTFRWNEIQAGGPDEWNLPITDAQLTAELNAGRQVVGLLVNTPGWATDLGIGPGVPMGLYLPASDPANAWANFVRAIVGRYAGRIDHWVIWNEPDIWESYHMSWGGSVEDYAQLLRVSHAAAHEANPGVVLHLAAMTHWWDVNYGRDLFFRRLMDVLMVDPNAPQNGYYFDVASMHVYFNPETLYDLTSLYLGIMWERGIRKPVWIMETNAAPSQDPSWPVASPQFNVSLNDQAAFVVQAFTLGIAAGAQRIAVYKLADTAQDAAANPEPFGLVRADGTRRPAFTAFQVASTYLAGFRSATVDQRDALMQVTVDRGDSVTTVAWARTAEGQTAAVFARATSALLVDMWGGARRIYPERGYYFVSLPGASCTDSRCIVGGLPLMVVENAPAGSGAPPPPPAPTVPPSQGGDEVLPSPTPDPNLQGFATPLPTNTPTPTATSTPTRTPRPSPTATATPTDTPTATPTATATATATPTPTPTASPTPTPTPVTFAGELRRVTQGEWVLGGVLLAGLGALTLARRMRKR